MRFVPINCVKDGMILGRELPGVNGVVLLKKGAVICSSYIDKLKELGYIGVYIEDDLSSDIEVSDVISQTIRLKTVKTVKSTFITVQNGKRISEDCINRLQSLMNDIAESLLSNKDVIINLIDLKVFDDYTYYHSVNVGILAITLGVALNLSKKKLYNLGLAAMLHDIGKVFISKSILNKPGKLTSEEFDIVKTHSQIGYEYLKKADLPLTSCKAVLQHHERFNGKGYPTGTGGKKISLFGRIIAIADVCDALASNRPYRKALVPSDIVEYIMSEYGSSFDPDLVDVFIRKIAPYPVGTCVSLSNGMIGIVAENYSDCCLRPKVKIIKHGIKHVEPYFIDLKTDTESYNITIIGISEAI